MVHWLISLALPSYSLASHFRAGVFSIAPDENDSTKFHIDQTYGWRRGAAGYPGSGCTQNDISTQKLSSHTGGNQCKLDGNSCGTYDASYFVTDMDDEGDDQWCYGYKNQDITVPNTGTTLEYVYSGCCWVTLTGDALQSGGGGWYVSTKIFDISPRSDTTLPNATPQVRVPPVWNALAGCKTCLSLNPFDPEGDKVKCRWAVGAECSGGCWDSTTYGSLSLDEETCTVCYDGAVDSCTDCVKPVAVQVEDYDENGNVLSSVGVQYLVTVFTPDAKARSNYGDRNICGVPPTFDEITPEGGDEITIYQGETMKLQLKATADVLSGSTIANFQYSSPIGMQCTDVNGAGEVTCKWSPTLADREKGTHTFCFWANDNVGLATERRCVNLLATFQPTCEATDPIIPAKDYSDKYEVFREDAVTTVTWQEARDKCVAKGSGWDLLTFENSEEVEYVNRILNCANEAFWVGYRENGKIVSDVFNGNTFSVSKTKSELGFVWGTRYSEAAEPNQESEECIRMRDGEFNDADCSLNRTGPKKDFVGMGYICKASTDECKLGIHECHEAATCTDTKEAYTCQCPTPNWYGDGTHCVDLEKVCLNDDTYKLESYMNWKGEGKHIQPYPKRQGCAAPTCEAEIEITDSWIRNWNKKRVTFGWTATITVPMDGVATGYTVLLRLPGDRERGSIQVWNARFWNFYKDPKTDELYIVLHSKPNAKNDTRWKNSFTVVADRLSTDRIPQVLYWPSYQRKHQCFDPNMHHGQKSGVRTIEDLVAEHSRLSLVDDVTFISFNKDGLKRVA